MRPRHVFLTYVSFEQVMKFIQLKTGCKPAAGFAEACPAWMADALDGHPGRCPKACYTGTPRTTVQRPGFGQPHSPRCMAAAASACPHPHPPVCTRAPCSCACKAVADPASPT